MKKGRILAFFLAAVSAVSLISCEDLGEGVELAYSDGFDAYGNYDDELFSYNGAGVSLADPGVIYVPEERDSVYGGYYYVYGTAGQTFIPNGYDYSAALDATKGFDEAYNIGEGNAYQTISAEHDSANEKVTSVEVSCYRSKDLSVWEEAGSLPRGYCALFTDKDWDTCNYSTTDPYQIGNCVCAPEVLYNEENGLYYMYYTREAKSEAVGMFNRSDRNRIGLAVSKYPCGPFTTAYVDDGGEYHKPMFSVQEYFEEQGLNGYGTIDVTVFIDDDGEKYMYFNHVQGGESGKEIGILGVKMTCWTHADFETIKLVLRRNVKEVFSGVGADCIINNNVTFSDSDENFYANEGAVNEGPQMLKHNGKYYISYSANGYDSKAYSIHQAVSDSPLGNFKKIGAVLDASDSDYTGGTGHHYFINKDGEPYIVYHRHGFAGGWNGYRHLAADRCVWTTDSEGNELLAANGPSMSLQWKKAEDGTENITGKATVSVSGGKGKEYLNDGMVPFYAYNEDKIFSAKGSATITLTFDSPVFVRALMVFNSKIADRAFNAVTGVKFFLKEQASWMSKPYDFAYIPQILLNERYVAKNSESIVACSSLVASFNEIKVDKITFDVVRSSEYLGYFSESSEFDVSEIAVLGRAQ